MARTGPPGLSFSAFRPQFPSVDGNEGVECAGGLRKIGRRVERLMMTGKPKLLSGGNPQIPKGYGEEPIEAYLDAVPGWKRAVCRRIDDLVSEAVPQVCKAVKWNSPFYGMEKDCWFLSFHCFDKYVKVTFFRGADLDPPPEKGSKYPAVRYHHVHERDELGDQFTAWVRQASKLPGERM